MNSGALRHLAQLQQPADLPPADPAVWPCAVLSDTPGGLLLGGRFHPAITLHTRVILKGHVYHVDHVANRQERDVELVVTCQEVFDDGPDN